MSKLTASQLLDEAKAHQHDIYMPGDAGYCDAEKANWSQMDRFPLSMLTHLIDDWDQWFKGEIAMDETEQLGRGYAAMLGSEIEDEIVVLVRGGKGYIWDGWHRAAASIVSGKTHIKAIVGVPEAEMTKEAVSGKREDSIVLVPVEMMPSFQKRLESLNKKAKGFGLEPIKVVSVEQAVYERKHELVGRDFDKMVNYLVPVRPGDDVEAPVLINRVRIDYPEIRLGNWRVVGKLEAIEGGNLAFCVTGDPEDAAKVTSLAECPIECEHCKTKRQRNDGYILRDQETGDYKEVGSNCLEDFTGIDPAAALFLARMYDVVRLSGEDFDEYASSGRCNALPTRAFLAHVSFCADLGGFVSTAVARDNPYLTPTYQTASQLPRALDESEELRDKYYSQRERHYAKADAIREWVANKPVESDFDRNVKLLLQLDVISIDRKHLALAAATLPMYNRYLGLQAEKRRPSEHIGQSGEKLTSTLTISRVIDIPNMYSSAPAVLVLMQDQKGNKLKWKTTSAPREVMDGEGRVMEASFKVKGHEDYKGVAQTSVTHLKVVRWLELNNENGSSHDTPEEHVPSYRVSIYKHPHGREIDYHNQVLDATVLTEEEVISAAAVRGIHAAAGTENIWFESESGQGDASYSLHIHDIDGREPTAMHYEQLGARLKAAFESRLEAAGATTDERPEMH
jgi:hypothetical protein